MKPDCILIEEIKARTVIGIFAEERERRQDVVLHLRLDTDARRAARSDSIEGAIDYKKVTKRIIAFVEDSSFQLIETLAERVAEILLGEFDTPCVQVTVEKPGALRHARTVSVTIVRERA